MAEYIEREKAVEIAEKAYHEWNLAMAAADGQRQINLVYKRQELCKAVAGVLKMVPAADVVPVVHGRWVKAENIELPKIIACSMCGHPIDSIFRSKFCPNCGAKMDLEVQDG